MVIYIVKNKISGKVYIGQTVYSLDVRKKQHIKLSKLKNTQFYNALRSYGETQFEWSILASANTKEELNELEIFYIKKYKSIEEGYNMVEGGTGGYNEYAVKTNKTKKGKSWEEIYNPEALEKMKKVAIITGKRLNDYTKNLSKEYRIFNSKIANKARTEMGYTHTEETKRKISESQKGITLEDRLGKEGADKRKKIISKKTKEAMSKLDKNELLKKSLIARKKYWNNKHQEDREKILELKRQGLKVKEIIAKLNVSYPTYYARLQELKTEGKL